MRMTICAVSLASMFALAPRTVRAADDPPLGWDLDARPLISVQEPSDVEDLIRTIAHTGELAQALATFAADDKVTSTAMLRFPYGGETTWFLYRTQDRAMVAQIHLRGGRWHSGYYAEVPPHEYDKVFKLLRDYRQGEPTPLTRNQKHWPHGYSGVEHVYDMGATRVYLIPASDIWPVDNPGIISDLLCDTLLSGMHCRSGPRTKEGQMMKTLQALFRTSVKRSSINDLLCQANNLFQACAKPAP
ncbi:hypothetical protein QPK31_00985 [Massilia sp. YIM B02769]|uniref:hypothetical protein n=1 Tax=Massilia sp. YIM B02769 TaxID=3050129 RepID=UPI0025B7224C|nr:hypothetical protein [Massilia sp. YIM B02769]MDN4056787.1 hypothetical protein [Massilia sp. YIM B02769]